MAVRAATAALVAKVVAVSTAQSRRNLELTAVMAAIAVMARSAAMAELVA